MGTTITAALPAPPGAHAQSHSLPASDKHTPPAPPGGPATAGFFAVVDQVRAFLAAEAVADGWAAPRSEGAGEQGGADGAVELARAGSSGGGRSRPPPDWDWVAGQLLPLLQQYSGKGEERRRCRATGQRKTGGPPPILPTSTLLPTWPGFCFFIITSTPSLHAHTIYSRPQRARHPHRHLAGLAHAGEFLG